MAKVKVAADEGLTRAEVLRAYRDALSEPNPATITALAHIYPWLTATSEPAPVEREWLEEDIVLDAQGGVYKRWTDDTWVEFANSDIYPNETPYRPLTLLVRDGKAVS